MFKKGDIENIAAIYFAAGTGLKRLFFLFACYYLCTQI